MKFVTPDHRHQVPLDLNNWGPRFGFAYRVDSKTVLRGAYALMYARLRAAGRRARPAVRERKASRAAPRMIISNDDGRNILATLSNPFPNGFNLPLGSVDSGPSADASTNLGLGIGESFFNDSANPIIQQWNANLQRELPGG